MLPLPQRVAAKPAVPRKPYLSITGAGWACRLTAGGRSENLLIPTSGGIGRGYFAGGEGAAVDPCVADSERRPDVLETLRRTLAARFRCVNG